MAAAAAAVTNPGREGLRREVAALSDHALRDQLGYLARTPALRRPGGIAEHRWRLLLAEQRRRWERGR